MKNEPDYHVRVVVVTGGRNYNDYKQVHHVLSSLDFVPEAIVQGGATGADALARRYADENKIQLVTFHANWKYLNKSAGPLRNRNMTTWVPRNALVIAFPGGRGTENCIQWAEENLLEVRIIPQ